MKKILIASVALICATSLCYAQGGDVRKATEPVGAVVEASGVIVGKITSVVEKSLGGGKTAGSLVLADDAGRTKVIPLDNTIKVLDDSFNGITLNQLKKGEKVSVEYSKDKSGAVKAKTVQVIKK